MNTELLHHRDATRTPSAPFTDWNPEEHLFVYGLLKQGFALNSILQNAGAERRYHLSKLQTAHPEFVMKSLRMFPGVQMAPSPHTGYFIRGELYHLRDNSIYATLDSIEAGYERRLVELQTGQRANMYVLLNPLGDEVPNVPLHHGAQEWLGKEPTP